MHRMLTTEGNGSHTANLLQFLAWIAAQTHTYTEMMIAWRTSCPRLSDWEDAITGSGDRGRRPSQKWTQIDSANAVARTGLSGFIDGISLRRTLQGNEKTKQGRRSVGESALPGEFE